ncbi:class I SAM-dependent methyltransferase [Henriciella barbarensis]|uniref:Class I SAM-dependent methyltransferase n=1 Tax=Henriciella barbarensis TaxID=86342 RepID=A0A399QYA5_9PROT|nr:class I SAM-dependent methyltransferase [Henriciella barbarensis]RIJ22299.1 class I SAM-dependent methyltransferase [Henriciella barbarensis]
MRRGAISLEGFEQKFEADADPWQTWNSKYEAVKRASLAKAIGPRPYGRGLEIAAGNGSNTLMIANKTRRLIATEGAPAGAALVRKASQGEPHIRVVIHDVADRLPADAFDLIVISELLYYLGSEPFEMLAREVSRTLQPGGRLVLLHHVENFSDRARPADHVHGEFTALLRCPLIKSQKITARRWRAESWDRARN